MAVIPNSGIMIYMKYNNEFRWIPCDRSAPNIDQGLESAISAEDLPMLRYAALVALDFQHRGSSAGIEDIVIASGTRPLPIIQIG